MVRSARNLMAFTLTAGEWDAIKAQAWQDRDVIRGFRESLRRFRQQHRDDVTACRLAITKAGGHQRSPSRSSFIHSAAE